MVSLLRRDWFPEVQLEIYMSVPSEKMQPAMFFSIHRPVCRNEVMIMYMLVILLRII